MTPRLLIALGTLALAACGGDRASAPGEVSEGEARALDKAAAMLQTAAPVSNDPAPVVNRERAAAQGQ
ncbi:MAG: hypothetical protein CVT75_13440 [Alphaproteobacteria bacterium HGW-Alphaproteobacteria-14]|nr:MAG: hypothetical protein CVT75_13440 [Alphaproteobacteria bacterium HGW-Alphaproteobacteria-14]